MNVFDNLAHEKIYLKNFSHSFFILPPHIQQQYTKVCNTSKMVYTTLFIFIIIYNMKCLKWVGKEANIEVGGL